MKRYCIALLVLTASVSGAAAQPAEDPYTIMRPEPWLPPKYQSPRGTRQHVIHPPAAATPHPRAVTPPPIVIPETGRVLPNLPVLPGAGPGGVETTQDRAARCAHQAGVYGEAAGDRNTYINRCINQ